MKEAQEQDIGSSQKSKITKSLLKDLGPRLPLGVIDSSGAYVKDLAVRPWRLKEERELGEIRDQNRDANVAQFVSMVLGTMCTRIGTHELETIKLPERRVIVSQMFMGDVFFAYIWLRIQALGPELKVDLTCPNCSSKFPFSADLETIEVTSAETLSDALWEYKLHHPFSLRSRQIERLQLGPARWNGLEMMSNSGSLNTGAAKAGIIRASVHGIPDKDGKFTSTALGEYELDEMSKRDIEEISNQIDKHAIGANMAIEGKCTKCRYSFKMPIDWGYDGFFAVSGQ